MPVPGPGNVLGGGASAGGSGAGSYIAASGGTGTNTTLAGATTITGDTITAYPAMTGTTVDITKPGQLYAATGNATVDVSTALASGPAGQV